MKMTKKVNLLFLYGIIKMFMIVMMQDQGLCVRLNELQFYTESLVKCVFECLNKKCTFLSFNTSALLCDFNEIEQDVFGMQEIKRGEDEDFLCYRIAYSIKDFNGFCEVKQKNDKFHVQSMTCSLTDEPHKPFSCQAIIGCQDINQKREIYPLSKSNKAEVQCETIQSERWTVVHRRFNGSVDFYRGWDEYKNGFGDAEGEYWIGNEALHALTTGGECELRVELEDFDEERRFAHYDTFSVGDESSLYKLNIGGFSGDAGDGLAFQNGMAFSTKDRDNDKLLESCAVIYHGAWWYKNCQDSNLNGRYYTTNPTSTKSGMNWYTWRGGFYSYKTARMMVRQH